MNETKFPAGLKVQIAKCDDFPCVVGKWGMICVIQDHPDKIRVSFDDHWGYFAPEQLEPISASRREMLDLLKKRGKIEKTIARLQSDLGIIEQRIQIMSHEHKLCPKCGAPLEKNWCHDDFLYKEWVCLDHNCPGSIQEY